MATIADITMRADIEFRDICAANNFIVWDVNEESGLPFTTGVSISWPQKSGEQLAAEAHAIADLAEQIAKRYRIKALYSDLCGTPYGGQVMYIGFMGSQTISN